MSEVESEVTLPSLAKRVEIIEHRLGIDPLAVVADEAASQAAGADAHAGNVQSDVAPPAVPESAESALELAVEKLDEGDEQGALDVLNAAVASWPDDEALVRAQVKVAKSVAAKAAEAEAEAAKNA